MTAGDGVTWMRHGLRDLRVESRHLLPGRPGDAPPSTHPTAACYTSVPMQSAGLRTSFAKATALSGAVHLALDAVLSRVPWTTPPYLLLDYASETFRDLLLLDRATLRVAIAVISAGVNGAIAGLFAVALAGARRRPVSLAASLFALWVFSGGLMILVYLDPPWGVALGSLAAGAPRAVAVAWVLERFLFRGEPRQGPPERRPSQGG
jgi:hypothetical protein